MAAKVHCPFCGAAFLYVDNAANTEVKCVRCGESFLPVVALPSDPEPKPIFDAEIAPEVEVEAEPVESEQPRPRRALPVARPVVLDGRSDESEPRRRRWDPRFYGPCPYGDSSKANAPAVFLLVMGIIHALGHLLFVALLCVLVLAESSVNVLEFVLVMASFLFVGLLKNYLTIRGALEMRKTRSRRWGYVGAIAAIIPDFIGSSFCFLPWIVALVPAIWCLVVLNDPDVKQAFAWKRYMACEE